MTNLKVIRESEHGRCWHDYRIVYYRGFYRVQEQLPDGTWMNRSRHRTEREATGEFNQWVSCHIRPEYR